MIPIRHDLETLLRTKHQEFILKERIQVSLTSFAAAIIRRGIDDMPSREAVLSELRHIGRPLGPVKEKTNPLLLPPPGLSFADQRAAMQHRVFKKQITQEEYEAWINQISNI